MLIAGGEQRCGEASARVVFAPSPPTPLPLRGRGGGLGDSEFFLRGVA
jgi:hypothetical protein